jgi:phage terminase large subunit-like protein
MANLSVRRDEAGNVKPDKARSSEKIDIAVAAIMAIGLWQAETVAARNHYDTNDLVEFTW